MLWAHGADARDVALLLAQKKAEAVSSLHQGAFVIGADQTLALGTELLHKPARPCGRRRPARPFKGQDPSPSCRGDPGAKRARIVVGSTDGPELTMRDFSANEREDILDREGAALLSSVGGYRLEGPSIRLFETVSGDYFTILGLPLLPLLAALRAIAPQILDGKP
jgi:septum formation protein